MEHDRGGPGRPFSFEGTQNFEAPTKQSKGARALRCLRRRPAWDSSCSLALLMGSWKVSGKFSCQPFRVPALQAEEAGGGGVGCVCGGRSSCRFVLGSASA